MSKLKVFTIGGASDDAAWMLGEKVNNLPDADVVLLTGGADIDPALYFEKAGSKTYPNTSRDNFELSLVRRAITLNKTIFGICRGAQLMCAVAGGKLVQDMNHPSRHFISFYDGQLEIVTTSCHHQMQYPYEMEKGVDYHILAYARGLSPRHLGQDDKQLDMPDVTEGNIIKEPEFVYYPKVRALGIQGHPEWMDTDAMLCKVLRAFITMEVKGLLSDALTLGLSVKEIIERADTFTIQPDEQELLSQLNNPKKVLYAEERECTGSSEEQGLGAIPRSCTC